LIKGVPTEVKTHLELHFLKTIYPSHIPNEKRGCKGGIKRMEKRRPSHLTVN